MYYSLMIDCFVVMDRMNIMFWVCVKYDIFLVFGSEDSLMSGIYYEIVIGGFINSKFFIRFVIGGIECVNYNGSFLSEFFFDEFWVFWIGGFVCVGIGSFIGSEIFMICFYLILYIVNFIWIMIGYGFFGEWRFINGI